MRFRSEPISLRDANTDGTMSGARLFRFHELNKGGPTGPPFLLSGMKSFLTSPRLVSAPHAPLQDAR